MSQAFAGRRVLIVEDESLVAMLLETILEDMGCTPVGPAATVDEGLRMVSEEEVVDAALLACALFAIEGSWLHRLFPPLVILGALHAFRPADRLVWTRDRGLLAILLAVAAAFGLAEPAIMLAALALVALNAAQSRAKSG